MDRYLLKVELIFERGINIFFIIEIIILDFGIFFLTENYLLQFIRILSKSDTWKVKNLLKV